MLVTYDPKNPAADMRLPNRQSPLVLGDGATVWNIKPTAAGTPGIKEISVDLFKALVLEKPGVKSYIQSLVQAGQFAMLAPGGKRTGGDISKWPSHDNAKATFGEFPPQEAINVVKCCVDMKQLELWKAIPGLDPNVAKEIGIQIDLLNPDIPKDF